MLFPLTRYELIGFIKLNSVVFLVTEQEYIEPTSPTNIDRIHNEMRENGFYVKKNNDFINEKFGIIIEDLHEENVLTNNDILFFIDTVIYFKS
jgi:hypothetical protein